MTRKPSPAVYRSKELTDFLKEFDPSHKFNRWIDDMATVLKENMLAGDHIPKRQIPEYYRRRFGVNNLRVYSHPEGYRSCYVLLIYDVGVCPLILDLKSHRDYEKIFGYRAR